MRKNYLNRFTSQFDWVLFGTLLGVVTLSLCWALFLSCMTGCASRNQARVTPAVELRALTNTRVQAPASRSLEASQELTLESNRQVQIVGPIMESGAATAARILDLGQKPGNLDVVINSPGGMVSTGLMILDAMEVARANGAVVRCLVAGKAFSMAFNLLTSCSEVYALPNTELLFHPVRIQTGMGAILTAFIAQQVVDMLMQAERKMIPRLIAWTGMPFDTFIKHYVDETMWAPDQLASASGAPIRVVTKVKGLDGSAFAWPKERKGLFDMRSSIPEGKSRDELIRFYKSFLGGAE